jgi:hypothetical protein
LIAVVAATAAMDNWITGLLDYCWISGFWMTGFLISGFWFLDYWITGFLISDF